MPSECLVHNGRTAGIASANGGYPCPEDAEFVVHEGDIRSARDGRTCEMADHENVAEMLRLSRTPVFIVPGGEHSENDCGIDNVCSISFFLLFSPLVKIMNGTTVRMLTRRQASISLVTNCRRRWNEKPTIASEGCQQRHHI